jgi:hypothetical protein
MGPKLRGADRRQATHGRNAYRRLGIHSREEAIRVIQAERFLELV